MKLSLLLLLALSFNGWVNATDVEHDTVEVYSPSSVFIGELTYEIPVNFDADQLLNNIPDSLRALTVMQVDLVYTTYRLNPEFDQKALNQRRKNRLQSVWPELMNEMIKWRFVGQSEGKTPETAKVLFHGFVVYFRPRPTAESIEAEIDFLDAILLNDESESIEVVVEEKPQIKDVDRIPALGMEGSDSRKIRGESKLTEYEIKGGDDSCYEFNVTEITGKKNKNAFLDSISKRPDFISWSYSTNGLIETKRTEYTVSWHIRPDSCDSIITYVSIMSSSMFSASYPAWMKKGDYGVVEAVFKRNADWDSTLIVMDVTGSMSPYIAKTMAWVKSTQMDPKVDAFVFFNDGDGKSDRSKRVGRVGGVYGTKNQNFSNVYSTMKSTMRKGGGGDCPENNIEATLYGVDKYGENCKEVVMVVDNWATPRDLSLVEQLDVPVHIILCGVQYSAINIQYLQLALDTGGSIHTIEDDLEMKGVKPGVSFRLGKSYFTIINGKIVRAEHKR